ncbi:MAG: hypothetical protein E5W57_17800 [Mesorhizobium sp.]|nr:MAG: hypothetical protein E5W57_17800 [Mesorhizobium sp.]
MRPSIADKQAVEQLKTCVRWFPCNRLALSDAFSGPIEWACIAGKPRLFVEIGVVTSAPVSRRELMRYAAREPAKCENMASQ